MRFHIPDQAGEVIPNQTVTIDEKRLTSVQVTKRCKPGCLKNCFFCKIAYCHPLDTGIYLQQEEFSSCCVYVWRICLHGTQYYMDKKESVLCAFPIRTPRKV